MSDIGQAFQDSLAGLSSAFSGGGGSGVAPTDLGTAISQAFSAAGGTAGATPSTTIDPTGSIGAQLAITPPGTSDPTGSIGGTQSGGAPQSGSTQQQGGGGGGGQGQQSQGGFDIRQLLKKLLGAGGGPGQTVNVNPYQTGAGAGANAPPWLQYPRWPGDPAYRPPSAATPGGSNEGASVQPEYGPGRPYEGPPGPGSREGESVQPEYGPGSPEPAPQPPARAPGVPATTQQPAATTGGAGGGGAVPPPGGIQGLPPPSGGLPAILPPGLLPSGVAAGLYGSLYSTPAETGELPPGGYSRPAGQGGIGSDAAARPPDFWPGAPSPPPADPKTGLPSDPVTGKPVTPEQYRKWFNEQTKKPATKQAPPTKTPPPTRKEGPPQGGPPPGGPPMGQPPGGGLGAILGPLMQSGLPQLALMALASGMFGGGRRRHGGGGHRFWDDRRHGDFRHGFYPSAHFRPRFYRHDDDGGGMNPALLGALMGGGPQGQPGQPPPGAGRPNYYQNPQGPGGGGATLSPDNPFIAATIDLEDGGRNIVSNTDTDDSGKTLAQGGNPDQISQGYFQIKPSTWRAYATQAGVDPNILPRQASYADQLKVASVIPFGQWGDRTKNALASRFGQLDPKMTFGQIASRFGATQTAAPSKTYLQPVQDVAYNPGAQ